MTNEAHELIEHLERRMDKLATPWRTTQEAAEYCRVSEATIRRLTAAGKLEAHRFQGLDHPKYHVDDLDAALGRRIKTERELAA